MRVFEEYGILDTAPEKPFDDIVDFASALCETPIALVSFVTSDRQWFKARHGLDATETPRSQSFCAFAMLENEILVVPDATLDPRFSDNPLVTCRPDIRFYAGAPLVSPEGIPLGSLCVIDTAPREHLTSLQSMGLEVLAAQVMTQLELRRRLRRQLADDRRLRESEQGFHVLADTMPQMVWSTLPDGFHDYYNARWYEFTGVPAGSTDGEGWNDMFHPDDQDRAFKRWSQSLKTGEPYEIEYRLRHHSGEYRWTLGRAMPIRDDAGHIVRWFGTCTDIHETKSIAEEREIVAQELSHRIKNIFAVIAGLINLSARTRPEIKPLADDLRTRIQSLGRAHDFVRPHSRESRPSEDPANLQGLLGALFEPYGDADGRGVHIEGDNPAIDDRAATPLALLFHELATNASKYGALSRARGRVDVSIEVRDDDCLIDWREHGGPAIGTRPELTGFGSRLIQLSVRDQLRGDIVKSWDGDGLHARITIPLISLSR
nr:PAS domain-containing protein [Sphingobium boeckii]